MRLADLVLTLRPITGVATLCDIINLLEAGSFNSGHRGHRGIPGYRGGSLPASNTPLGWPRPKPLEALPVKEAGRVSGIINLLEGGAATSGHYGHRGIPGYRGGSLPATGGALGWGMPKDESLAKHPEWMVGIIKAYQMDMEAKGLTYGTYYTHVADELNKTTGDPDAFKAAMKDAIALADDIKEVNRYHGWVASNQDKIMDAINRMAAAKDTDDPAFIAAKNDLSRLQQRQTTAQDKVHAAALAVNDRVVAIETTVANARTGAISQPAAAPVTPPDAPPRNMTAAEKYVYTGKIGVKDFTTPQDVLNVLNTVTNVGAATVSYYLQSMPDKIRAGYIPTKDDIALLVAQLKPVSVYRGVRRRTMEQQAYESEAEFARRQAAGQKLAAPEYNAAKNTAVKLPPESISNTWGTRDSWSTRGTPGVEGTGDPLLFEIYKYQGFNGKAKVVPPHIFDDMVKAEGARVLYRGLHSELRTSQFRERDHFAGYGIYGNGTYTSPDWTTAVSYATNMGKSSGINMRVALRPGARVTTMTEMRNVQSKLAGSHSGTRTEDDEGRLAAWLGYDAMEVGSPNHILILNRSALIVDSTNYKVPKAEY